MTRHHVLVEEVVEDEPEDAREKGDAGDREERREATIATCRLAVPTRPEAREREDERGDSQRPECRDVDDEPPDEPEYRAGDRAAQEPQCDDGHEQDVRRPAANHDRGHDDDLQHRGDERDGERPEPDRGGHRRSVGTRTITESSAPKSTYGSTCTCWKRSVSV